MILNIRLSLIISFVLLGSSTMTWASDSLTPSYDAIFKAGKSISIILNPKIHFQNQDYNFAKIVRDGANPRNFMPSNSYCRLLFGSGSYTYITGVHTEFGERRTKLLNINEQGEVNEDLPFFNEGKPVKAVFCFVPEGNMPADLEDVLEIKGHMNPDGSMTVTDETFIKIPFTMANHWEILSYTPSKLRFYISDIQSQNDDFCRYIGHSKSLPVGPQELELNSDESFFSIQNDFISDKFPLDHFRSELTCIKESEI